MNNPDIYDNGTPKYQSATDIYDALRAVESGEEIGILSEMYADVSWDNQDYYYTDNGGKLMERWNKSTEYGNKMWMLDVAVFQLDENSDANDWMYEVLCNDDLAKRIGFKKIFVEMVLSGLESRYKQVSELFSEELGELNRFGFCENAGALSAALDAVDYIVARKLYSGLCSALYEKLKGLRLDSEKQLIVESRALLTAYDDFMYGLKSNQYLYNQQETMYQSRVAQLQEKYGGAVKALLLAAQAQGIALELPRIKLLEGEIAWKLKD